MSKASERQEKMIGTLRKWQGLERTAIESTAEIMEQTDNSLIRQVMEIIRNDSVQHHRVQQYIIDTMTKAAPVLSREDMATVWSKLEEHDKLERETIAIAKELKEETRDHVHKLLLDYLIRDEEKHDTMCVALDALKTHMSKLA